jgi:hypothetical protein
VAPAHFFGREAIHFVAGRDRRAGLIVTGQFSRFERLRRKRCGLRARGQRCSARGKSKGNFQKVAAFHVGAFHDISL